MRVGMILLVALLTTAGANGEQGSIKIAGETMFPSELVFMDPDPRSQAHAEGTLGDGCEWELDTVTRTAPHHTAHGCVEYFYKTTVTMTRKCAAPRRPQQVVSERMTKSGRMCATENRPLPEPKSVTLAVSSGRIPDGRFQDIVEQPDGSRVTINWSPSTVDVRVVYPDKTIDILQLPTD